METKPILIVHPKDRTTFFLNRTKNHLIRLLPELIHHFNIHPNEKSHQDCLKRISEHPESGLVIFLGHGRSDKLYGSRGELFGTFENELIKAEHPQKYYGNDSFVDDSNIQVFSGKKVFCLACNSNSKIAVKAMESGAKTFLGFGAIPTSTEEFEDIGIKNVSHDLVKAMKTELNYIIKISLTNCLIKNYDFNQLYNFMIFLTNQKISEYKLKKIKFKDSNIFADCLYQLKKDILILGDKKAKLFE